MILVSELVGDRDTAVIVLHEAMRLAPCLGNLVGDDRMTAVAILNRTIARSAALASTLKTRTAGDWSQTRFSPEEIGSAFLPDDRVSLQAMCGISAAGGVGPLGCFPSPAGEYRP